MRNKILNSDKISFLIAGGVNILLTNILLQLLLRIDNLGIIFPTFISQSFNGILGYVLYGKYVFKGKRLRRKIQMLRFYLLMSILWLMNSLGITFAQSIGLSKTFAAIAMIPILASISYYSNKWIFNK